MQNRVQIINPSGAGKVLYQSYHATHLHFVLWRYHFYPVTTRQRCSVALVSSSNETLWNRKAPMASAAASPEIEGSFFQDLQRVGKLTSDDMTQISYNDISARSYISSPQ